MNVEQLRKAHQGATTLVHALHGLRDEAMREASEATNSGDLSRSVPAEAAFLHIDRMYGDATQMQRDLLAMLKRERDRGAS